MKFDAKMRKIPSNTKNMIAQILRISCAQSLDIVYQIVL